MEKNSNVTPLFITLIAFSLIVFFLDRIGVLGGIRGIVENVLIPPQRTVNTLKAAPKELVLPEEKLLELEKLRGENEDLRMQLGVPLTGQKLVLADVLSTSRFFIIDKGIDDGVRVGNTVIFKNVLIGKIATVSEKTSRVLLPSEKGSTIRARAMQTGALGLVKGEGEHAIFSEVTLSENLTEGDSVITVGDVDEQGLGVRPGFLIGKIETIRKSENQLFQEAKLVPLVEYEHLQNVFIIL